jgi:hypothetical protein
MKVERGLLAVEHHHAGLMIRACADNVPERIVNVVLDEDEARWLMLVGLPAILAAEVPSEPTVSVRDASNDEGQIEGQLAID